MPDALRIRAGSITDARIVVELFDEAVEWLRARGQTGQWGATRYFENPARQGSAEQFAGSGGMWVATLDFEPAGVLVLDSRGPEYVAPAPGSELYIRLLISSRRHAGKRIGSALVEHAAAQARARGRALLRVDCWAGAPKLLAWYERQGFRRTDTFELNGARKAQIFEMPIGAVSR